jgi:pyruvate,orthophosphate dikinase
MASDKKWVYFFGKGIAEGRNQTKALLGGKGLGLAQMTAIGLPVPAGFTIITESCDYYYKNGKRWPGPLEAAVKKSMARLEKVTRKRFGDPKRPLFVSVRSGAALSMPGMMETILNLGLNDHVVESLGKMAGNRRFALDAYRRLIMMYGSTAMGVERHLFDHAFDEVKERQTRARLQKGPDAAVADTDVNETELEAVVAEFKRIYQKHTGQPFPQDAYQQLKGAISAVFNSWMAKKAVDYRNAEKITGLKGTAVNVQEMVFGNMGEDCGTGVCFTRDPNTGENLYYGDMLFNAQGEDVVAGVRTPLKLEELHRIMPDVYDQLEAVRIILEVEYGEMQDLEFTIEQGELFMLQCRTGKRSPAAAFEIAVDQASKPLIPPARAKELIKKKLVPKATALKATKPLISREAAVARIKPVDIERLFYPEIDWAATREERRAPSLEAAKEAVWRESGLATGINAVPGAACGKVAMTADQAEAMAKAGEKVILVRKETSPEDVGGMHAAVGILTATGGKTSHAAVVARGWGKCCIVGCEALKINEPGKQFSVNGKTVREGDSITLDGSADKRNVYQGSLRLIDRTPPAAYHTLMKWCDDIRRLKVRTNADTPEDSAKAVEMGAEGIGLCRTEHMFFATEQRQLAMQEMIVADTEEARRHALDKLLPFQRDDFIGIFKAMDGKPVTIRLIDPPLHEFVPHTEDKMKELAQHAGLDLDHVRQRVHQLAESNPMLGHRGCRLCITYPEILEMQVRAIIEAAIECRKAGVQVFPEIMIPLTIDARELGLLVDRTKAVADAILAEKRASLTYLVGTMIETPRAALTADRIAETAEFFSFGTNDLTQTTMALSRDDAGRFLPEYCDKDKTAIFADDPFQSLDVEGVGQLVQMGIERGRSTRPKLKVGICGEHGGEAASVKFCHRVGMDYVSCSPYRVPIARLAAAQAVIESGAKTKGKSKGKAKGRATKAKAKVKPPAGKKTKKPAKRKK